MQLRPKRWTEAGVEGARLKLPEWERRSLAAGRNREVYVGSFLARFWYKPDEWKNKVTRPDLHLLSQPRR